MSNQLQVSGAAKIRDIQGPVVANSGVISALDGAASQYVRGDGTLADFPSSTGGGSSVSYYLNSSVSQGTIGGVAYRELSKEPIIGAGTDIAIAANGYVANYLTDANDPDVLSIPGGNFNCEFYFSVNNNTGAPYTYAELYKYDGSTFTLLGSSVGVPEYINQGTIIAPYYFAIPVPTSALAVTDRLAIRIYVNVDGRTVTLHTENSHLCQVVTTLSKGMVSLNNLTDQSQYLATGTSGTDFNIVSSVDTHTFNLPVASASNTGKLSSTDWSTFNGKVPYTGANADVNLGTFDLSAYAVSADILEARLNGTASSPLILRTGTSGFASGLDAISLISSPSSANTLSIISDVSSVTKRANIGLGLLTATRTYTLPDASGTLALTSNLSSYVPYTGATANVDLGINSLFAYDLYANGNGTNNANLYLKQGISSLLIVNGYSNILATGTKIGFQVATSAIAAYYADLQFSSLTAQRTYTLPDASGTLALLESTQTFSGTNTFNSGIKAESGIFLKELSSSGRLAGYVGISTTATGGMQQLQFLYPVSGSSIFSLPTVGSYNYEFPTASGTLALTSDLSGYVTLATAQTITANKTFSEFGFFDKGVLLKQNIYPSASGYNGIGAISGGFYFSIGQTTVQTLLFNSTTPYQYTFPSATGTLSLGTGTTNYVSKWTGTNTIGNSLIFDNGTNVGIGNTNTSYTLDVTGTVRATGYFALTTTSEAYAIQGTLSWNSARGTVLSGKTASVFDIAIYGAAGQALITNPTGTSVISFPSGNVGIGTSSPSCLLHLQKAGGAGTIIQRIQNDTIDGYSGTHLYGSDGILKGHYGWANTSAGTLADKMYFGTIAAKDVVFTSNDTERMRITSGGNVGIGNTGNPFFRFRVTGASSTSSDYCISCINSAGTDLFYVRNDGVVYTGTAALSPYNLTTGNSANLFVASDGGLLRSTSSLKYKKNVKNYTKGLAEIMQLRAVTYQGKNDRDNDKQFAGLIAEEVHELGLTEFVQYAEDGTPDALAYQNMIALLVKGMQEQQALITSLQEQINELKNK